MSKTDEDNAPSDLAKRLDETASAPDEAQTETQATTEVSEHTGSDEADISTNSASDSDPVETPEDADDERDQDLSEIDSEDEPESLTDHEEPAQEDTRAEQDNQNEPAQKPVSSFWPMLLGGVVAGGLGFLLALMLDPQVSRDDFNAALARIDELENGLENLPEPQMPEIPDPVDLTPLQQTLAQQADQIADLSSRFDQLLTTANSDGTVPAAAFEMAIADLQAVAAAQQAEISALLAEAEAARNDAANAAQASVARSAVTQIITALDQGAPFSEALATLSQTNQVAVPEALSSVSEEGVVTLTALQTGVAEAARSALSAARQAEDAGTIGSFLERQLGARSVTPREGDDADAVLSRVEAAVKAGNLAAALDEAAVLPEPAKDAFAPWMTDATERHNAVSAATAIAETLSTR